MRTVRSIQHQVLAESGGLKPYEFCRVSTELRNFWCKLIGIGNRSMEGQSLASLPADLDEATEVSDSIAEQLVSEFRSLLSKNN